jgi:L-asparaginase II
MGMTEQGIGVAVRIDDGNARASAPAALAVLGQLLSWDAVPAGLRALSEPVLANTVGDPVVHLKARVELS